jgi:transmembrane sensor
MSDWIDQFIFYDELNEEARDGLNASLEHDGGDSVSQAFDEWKLLRERLRIELGTLIPDRERLIHFAMWRHGNASLLTSEELKVVQANLPYLEDALRRSAALRSIVERIGDEQLDFQETWQVYAGTGAGNSRASSLESIHRRRSSQRSADFFWRAAAVFLIAISTAALYKALDASSGTIIVRSSDDGVRQVALDDGTLVRLVNGGELTYSRPTADEPFDRKVSLTGRALFRVSPGDQQFVVQTPAAVTTVWGTTFGLDSDESFTEVVLAEGRVSVVSIRDSHNPVVLEPGEMTRVVGAREPTPPVRVNLTDALSYTRLFVFRNEKTLMIANKLTEHFGVPVSVSPGLSQESVTGTFERNWSLEYILRTVARTLDAEVRGSEEEGYNLVRDLSRGP